MASSSKGGGLYVSLILSTLIHEQPSQAAERPPSHNVTISVILTQSLKQVQWVDMRLLYMYIYIYVQSFVVFVMLFVTEIE